MSITISISISISIPITFKQKKRLNHSTDSTYCNTIPVLYVQYDTVWVAGSTINWRSAHLDNWYRYLKFEFFNVGSRRGEVRWGVNRKERMRDERWLLNSSEPGAFENWKFPPPQVWIWWRRISYLIHEVFLSLFLHFNFHASVSRLSKRSKRFKRRNLT